MNTKIINLKDGATLLITQNHNIRGISIAFSFNAGAINDPTRKLGTAHFCEHAVQRFSTPRFTQTERLTYRSKFKYTNANTGLYNVNFLMQTTQTLLEEGFDYLTHTLSEINFSQEEFDSEQKVIESEILSTKSNNATVCNKIFRQEIIKNKNINKVFDRYCGTLDTLKNIKLNDVKNYIKEYFTLNNLTIVLTGNIKLSQAKKLIQNYVYPRIPTSQTYGLMQQHPQLAKPAYHFQPSIEKDASVISLVFPVSTNKAKNITLENEKFYSFLSNINSQLLSRFFRTDKNLCYSCFSSFDNTTTPPHFQLILRCSDDKVEQILSYIPEFIKLHSSGNDLDKELFDNNYNKCNDSFNFDVTTLDQVTNDSHDLYEKYNMPYGKHIIKKIEKILKNLLYEDVNQEYKNIYSSQPHIIIISNDKKWKDFDYNAYYKKFHEE